MANMEDTALTLNTALTPNDVCVLVTAELGLDWSVRFNENPTIGTFEVLAERAGRGIGLSFPTHELSTRPRDSFKWEIKTRLKNIMGRSTNG